MNIWLIRCVIVIPGLTGNRHLVIWGDARLLRLRSAQAPVGVTYLVVNL